MKAHVYLAAPYSKGDQAMNVRSQMRLFSEMMDDGIVIPYAPLLTHFVHLVHPKSYDQWLSHCLAVLDRMDYVLAMPATEDSIGYMQVESKGMALEITHCKKIGTPVFYSLRELYEQVTRDERGR